MAPPKWTVDSGLKPPPKQKAKAKAKPKRPPAEDVTGIGAPYAPTTGPFVTKPASHHGRELAAEKKRKKAAAEAEQARNDMIFAQRQDAATKKAIQDRVSAASGLVPIGQGLGQKGAAKPYQGQVQAGAAALARERLNRLKQGGLLSDSQRLDESLALDERAGSRGLTFRDTHQLPRGLTKPAVASSQPSHRLLMGAPEAPVEKSRYGSTRLEAGAVPGHRDWASQALHHALSNMQKGFHAQDAVKLALNTVAPLQGQGEQVAALGHKFAKRVAPSAGSVPHVLVDRSGLTPEAAKAAGKGGALYADELTDAEKYGDYVFTPERRKKYAPMIEANGWNIKDMPQWNDAEMLARAYNKFNPSLPGWAQNFAADVGEQANLASAPSLAADTIEQMVRQRSLTPGARLGGQMAMGWKNLLPGVGDRPWGENIYEKPLSTYLAVAPFAKGASLRAGKAMGLGTTREVTLPSLVRAEAMGQDLPHGTSVTLPASQELVHRGAQIIHDRLLRSGLNPSARAQRQQPTTIRGDLRQQATSLGGIPERVGHALEQRVVNRGKNVGADRALLQARMEVGHDPHVALSTYAKRVRQLPMMQGLKFKGKQELIESIARHHLSGSTHEEWTAYFHSKAAKARALADKWEREALDAKSTQEADQLLSDARDQRRAAEAQQAVGDWSAAHRADIFNPGKGEQALADAMYAASKQQSKMLKDAGIMDDKGVLFGDWQHRLEIVRELEGTRTEMGRLATHIEHLRQQHTALRSELHGVQVPKEGDVVLPASADFYSPESQHQLGRVHRADQIAQAVESATNARSTRQADVASRIPNELLHDPNAPYAVAGRAVVNAGLAPIRMKKMLQDVVDGISQVRRKAGERGQRFEDNADLLKAKEQAEHARAAGGTVARLETQLRTMRDADAPPTKMAEVEQRLEQAKQDVESGYKPSAKVLEGEHYAEKVRLWGEAAHPKPREIAALIDKHFTPAEQDAIGRQKLEDAANHAADSQSRLPELRTRLGEMRAQAAEAFKASSGKDVELALRFEDVAAKYKGALKRFAKEQEKQGRRAAHLHLHQPGSGYNLQPVTVTTGEQFARGDFTPDMHFFLAHDLEGLTRKAVEAKFFAGLGETSPFIIHDPPPGSEIPPGFVRVKKDSYSTLLRVNRDNAETQSMLEEWKAAPDRQESGATVPYDDGESVLISHDLMDRIALILNKSGPGSSAKEINGLLKVTNTYRRWMLYTLPRTLVNNTLGNPLLAALMGSGLRTLIQSHIILNKYPELLNNVILKRGPVSNVGEGYNPLRRGPAKMTGWQQTLRHANTFAEDNGNFMVYLMDAKKAYKSDNDLKFWNAVSVKNEDFAKFLHDAATGKDIRAHEWAAHSAETFGDMFKASRYDNGLATAFLFHRWVGHMIHLQLWTMPMKYPGRTLFLQQTAQLAEEYRKKHGLFPEWASSMIPLWQESSTIRKKLQLTTWALSGQGANPFATAGQTFDLGTPGQPKFPLQSVLAANLNPIIRVAAEFSSQHRLDTLEPYKDAQGNELKYFNWRQGVQDVIANTPIVNTLFSRAGQADTSIQIPIPGINTPQARYTSTSATDASMSSPVPYGHGLWKDLALVAGAAFGASVRPVDAKGTRTLAQANATLRYQQRERSKRQNQQAKANAKLLKTLNPEERKAWYKQHDPAGFKRHYPNG